MEASVMAALCDEQTQQGYLKAGLLGFPKSGKSYTATMLAIATKRLLNLPGQIAMFDTEAGSVYLSGLVKELTGQDLLAIRRRSLKDLVAWGKACLEAGISVGIVDSVTHPWRELCDSYLKQKNDQRRAKRLGPQDKLQFQDWGPIKERWNTWSEFYLNSPLHIVICGRAGFDYDFVENEDGKDELRKTGIKMKTEGEFGFEPSLLVEMNRNQSLTDKAHRISREAIVLGDRFGVVDGKVGEFHSFGNHEQELAAVSEFFGPHLQLLVPGCHAPVNVESRTEFDMVDGEDSATAERRKRTILVEEIQGELTRVWPGQTAKEKAAKLEAIERHFNTRSWTAVESMGVQQLSRGLSDLRTHLASITSVPAASDKDGE